jgi:predicted nucleotidyltransferase
MVSLNFPKILKTLVDHDIAFIVVGGISGVLHGATLDTFDLDVVHSRESANVAKLLTALEEMDACYRIQPERKLRPDASHLSSPGHQLLLTAFGPVDFLGSVTKERGYAELLEHSEDWVIPGNIAVKIISMEMLILLKQETGRPRDLAQLPILRRTLEEIQRRKKKTE